ncbi:hypothetical protein N7535_002571 [Penicillium sp. DV-2018c]|nr:hypothetical protein N7535_002571 [Penicillium sp. DV-2018c]
MNTIRSTWVGWGTLCLAGGGAYYFAKQSINADRQARFEAEVKHKAHMKRMEEEHSRKALPGNTPSPDGATLQRAHMARHQNATDDGTSPSVEASSDPAATRHEPLTEADRVVEKSKYETAQPYRPPSGNRFS